MENTKQHNNVVTVAIIYPIKRVETCFSLPSERTENIRIFEDLKNVTTPLLKYEQQKIDQTFMTTNIL